MDDLTDFEKVYNRVYRDTIVDTRHINSCEEL